jgi:type I restriction enzyme M protein
VAININDIAERLWDAADKLRANTPLRSSEYSLPVLGLIFLKFADQKFAVVEARLKANGRTVTPTRVKAEGAIYLDEKARFVFLRSLSQGVGTALNETMRLIEQDNTESLSGSLPTNAYTIIDDAVLKPLLTRFDSLSLDIEGDIFGKIYEYFLGKFARSEGQRGGEFFTPTPIVKLIVEIIEPYQGRILDPACGTGGMFVQSAQFVQRHKRNFGAATSIYGQEKTRETVKLCKMNLAVNGLQGNIHDGNSYYENPFATKAPGQDKADLDEFSFDFVMANPPFNVDGVDKDRLIEVNKRYPFQLPRVDNANYLWIQLFYSSLSEKGRAGFVMPNSASDARSSEQDIRRQLIEAHVVDVMVTVGPNFFYTVTLPCTLWFFDKGKRESERRDRVLFIDARQIYRQIDRAHREFTPEQIEFLANIVRLYRGEQVENENGSAVLMAEHFPDGVYADIPGLCKAVTLADIAEQGYSLNPGRYVGVAERILEDFDFKERLEELHEELTRLTGEAHVLEERIDENMSRLLEEMGD